uniref:Uncharacterized protein n=1 Tax=Chromera velia CCMP2878 TaxID=1169474 RepID=A0A0G4IAE2_9ALVE|eukprot:Cvel_12463.t1-p1 / transcript=Cvel_12463.t1 / gene=Cvel_12463 / organism=Chromera_velia_CCMP2878 / gene_product=Ribonuclease Y, putative / transcript_product=Ribonuclease Y, putative / location=Cvel_scaffold817:18826-22798(-) / protein_length=333 / sequence_SO=supercontig / SO=protein_coding / is_pseudo=false
MDGISSRLHNTSVPSDPFFPFSFLPLEFPAASLSDLLLQSKNSLQARREVEGRDGQHHSRERDSLFEEKERLKSERDSVTLKRDSLFEEKERLKSERGSVTLERDSLFEEKERLKSERDSMNTFVALLEKDRETAWAETENVRESTREIKERLTEEIRKKDEELGVALSQVHELENRQKDPRPADSEAPCGSREESIEAGTETGGTGEPGFPYIHGFPPLLFLPCTPMMPPPPFLVPVRVLHHLYSAFPPPFPPPFPSPSSHLQPVPKDFQVPQAYEAPIAASGQATSEEKEPEVWEEEVEGWVLVDLETTDKKEGKEIGMEEEDGWELLQVG